MRSGARGGKVRLTGSSFCADGRAQRAILTLLGTLIYLTGCGLKAPTAAPTAVQTFAHIGITSNCASCHDTGKPFAAFPASGHIATNGQDCGACHTTVGWTSGGTFSHSPTPTQCASCHSNALPSGLINEMNHAMTALPDCLICHSANIGVSWAEGFLQPFAHTLELRRLPFSTAAGRARGDSTVQSCERRYG